MELQQSPLYAHYIERLGWRVIQHENINIFIRRFPIIGSFAKIQRIERLPALDTLVPILKNNRVRIVTIEPAFNVRHDVYARWHTELGRHFRLTKTPFLPTKSIIVDLQPEPEEIFRRFSEAKRRAVRRAAKNTIMSVTSNEIDAFIKLKNAAAGLFGFITTTGLRELWHVFAPEHAIILFAYRKTMRQNNPIAGILLVFWEDTAYYWIAAATKAGKKAFAPTLLVWKALQVAKHRGMKSFDFVGVWDERLARKNREWLGFTKFKEGFGGKSIYYPIALP